MSYPTQGSSNRQIYDCCAYSQSLQQSVEPLDFQLYFGACENCSKCIDKKAWYKQDEQIVNIESELWNITRPLSKCDKYKYNPGCKTSPMCTSTFDPSAPRVLSPSLCPIVYNNIPVQTSPGYNLPNPGICGDRTGANWTEASSVNTYNSYNGYNRQILGNEQNTNMFLNSCSNTPLYNGGMNGVRPYFVNSYNSAPVQSRESGSITPAPVSEQQRFRQTQESEMRAERR